MKAFQWNSGNSAKQIFHYKISMALDNIPRHLFGPQDNIGKDLYVPCLKKCKLFRRATGFFRPSVLRRWSPALKDIVKNGTKIEILMGISDNSHEIVQRINEATDPREKERILKYEFFKTMQNIKEFNSGDRSEAKLSQIIRYLIANEQLEIKFSAAVNEDGKVALAHEKIGYFYFEENEEYVLFEGSANESDTALLNGGEQVTVHKSSEPSQLSDLKVWQDIVDNIWEEKYEYRKVFEADHEIIEAIKQSERNTSKEDVTKIIEDYLKESGYTDQTKTNEDKLRPYQEKAIKSWFDNDCKGIIAHATGTCKTFTSINLVKKLIEDKSLSVVVGVPYVFLADQWVSILNEIFKNYETHKFNGVIECYGSRRAWEKEVGEEMLKFRRSNNDSKKHLSIYVTVNKTFSEDSFQKWFNGSFIDLDKTIFIGDECHRYTSKVNFNSLLETKFRLGLSATPFIDENNKTEAEQLMSDYFDGTIHEYSISKALDDGYLCEYKYEPLLCYLNSEEFTQWHAAIRNLKIDQKIKDDGYLDEESSEFKEISKIISISEEKFEKFNSLLDKLGSLDKAVIFCGERKLKNGKREVEYAGEILDSREIISTKITAEVGREDRDFFIKQFKSNNIKCLNAIRVLDEGIDIPAIETAIILASSANRRQFVQRRGRVLRKSEDENKLAVIYDFIILPAPYKGEEGKGLVHKELERMEEMSEGAINEEEIYNLIKEIKIGFENAQS